MKELLFSLIVLLICTSVVAQPYEIRSVNKGNGIIGVEVRATAGTPPGTGSYVTDLTFGLKWQSSYNVDLESTINTAYNIVKSGGRVLKNGFHFQAFFADNTPTKFPINWQLNQWIEVMNISNNLTGVGTGTFSICENGFDFSTGPNIGVDLNDYTPLINGSATGVLLGMSSALPPTITSFAPSSAPVGASMTISGQNFNTTFSNNIVYFGAVRATVTGGNTTSLTVSVPAGATYQPISVLNSANGLTGYSFQPFSTTFVNPFGSGIPPNFYLPKVDFTAASSRSVAIGDLDGDGRPDLVALSFSSMYVLRKTSSPGAISGSSFAAPVTFPAVSNAYAAYINDVDGDGKPDIVVMNYNASFISVFRNTSTIGVIDGSSFSARIDLPVSHVLGAAIGDMDGDGRPDIVTGNSTSFSVLRNTSVPGTISFDAKVDYGSFPQSDNDLSRLAINDLDGDGKLDIAIQTSQGLLVYRNATGVVDASLFAAPVVINNGGGRSVAAADIDGDGKADLIVNSDGPFSGVSPGTYYGAVFVIKNVSAPGTLTSASFSAPVKFQTGYNPFSYVSIGDLDGDGKPDIVTSSGNSTSVLLNKSVTGSITVSSFDLNVDFQGGTFNPVAIGDLDGNGIPELVVANNAVSVFSIAAPNTNQITFSGKVYLQGASNVANSSMDNSLNASGILQANAAGHPYVPFFFNFATDHVPAGFFAAHTDIVDWVLLELRDAATPSTIVAKRSAFVKQNGTLVDIDGASILVSFPVVSPGNYYVAIRHRNHLGIRSATPVDFTSGTGSYDFTTAANKCYQNQPYTSTVPLGAIWAMRAGNASVDNTVKYNGPNNDQNQILNIKLGGSIANILTNVYSPEDVNMNGEVKWNGPGNDQNFLLNVVLAGLLSTVINEQL